MINKTRCLFDLFAVLCYRKLGHKNNVNQVNIYVTSAYYTNLLITFWVNFRSFHQRAHRIRDQLQSIHVYKF